MRKLIILSLIALIPAVSAFGQNAGHKFEAGLGFAPFLLASVDDGQTVPYKYDAYLEWRYEFDTNNAGRSFDVGAKLDYKAFPTKAYNMGTTIYSGTQHDIALLAIADFNFNPGGKVNPFIGLGLGPGVLINNWKGSKSLYSESESHDPAFKLGAYSNFVFIACPRIGVELFQHLRLSASVDGSLSDTRWPLCFSVGWTF